MTPDQLAENGEVQSLVALLKSIDSEIDRRQAIGNDTPGLASISRLFSQKASTVKALSKLKETLGYYVDGEQIQAAERAKQKLWEDLVNVICADDEAAWQRYHEFLSASGIDQPTEEDIRHAEADRREPAMRAEWQAQQQGDEALLAWREARLATLLLDVEEIQHHIATLKTQMAKE
jgi:hypothetical protein